MLKGTVENGCPRYIIYCQQQKIAIEKERGRCHIVKGQEDQIKEIVFHVYDID